MHPAFFYLLSFVAIAAALAMVTQRHPLPAAFALVLSFLGLAGVYALLVAPLMAILQILVYAGAIMALVVFVIMLLNVRDEDLPHEPGMPWQLGAGFAVGGVFFAMMVDVLSKYNSSPVTVSELSRAYGTSATGEPLFGGIATVGQVLFLKYTFPFEVISVLLTVAVVGVVVLAKRRI